MADYQITSAGNVVRVADEVWISTDPDHRDRQAYDQWLADGGVPDPYPEPPPPAPAPTEGEEVAFDHENRIRALEGQPPLTLDEFMTKMG